MRTAGKNERISLKSTYRISFFEKSLITLRCFGETVKHQGIFNIFFNLFAAEGVFSHH